jgi:hypothetical protein
MVWIYGGAYTFGSADDPARAVRPLPFPGLRKVPALNERRRLLPGAGYATAGGWLFRAAVAAL